MSHGIHDWIFINQTPTDGLFHKFISIVISTIRLSYAYQAEIRRECWEYLPYIFIGFTVAAFFCDCFYLSHIDIMIHL